MADVPAPKQSIGKGLDGKVHVSSQCGNPWCFHPVGEVHHICRRSFLGGAFNLVELYGKVWPNVVGLCHQCHAKLEANQAHIRALEHEGRYVWREDGVSEFLDPHPVLEDGESPGTSGSPFPAGGAHGGAPGSPSSSTGVTEGGTGEHASPSDNDSRTPDVVTGQPSGGPPSVAPGSTCPKCLRRVPHARKLTSPKSKVFGMRVPLDEAETFGEIVDAAADHLGVKDQPHHRFKTLSLAAALVLQDEGLRDFGRR